MIIKTKSGSIYEIDEAAKTVLRTGKKHYTGPGHEGKPEAYQHLMYGQVGERLVIDWDGKTYTTTSAVIERVE